MSTDVLSSSLQSQPASELKTALGWRLLMQIAGLSLALFSAHQKSTAFTQPDKGMYFALLSLTVFLVGQGWYWKRVTQGSTAVEKNDALKDYGSFSGRFFAACVVLAIVLH